MDTVLNVNSLTMHFGGLRALDAVDIEVRREEIVALIGPNGAGKTTFFNCLTGIYEPTEGDIFISPTGEGRRRINGIKINRIAEMGIARTFQSIRLFSNMTVLENVMIGRHCRTKAGVLGAVLRGGKTRREEQEIVDRSYEILVRTGLADQTDEPARNLPYGAQRRLKIARAIATEPFLLLLDEPAAGMNPRETDELKALIVRIRDEAKISILMIEHDMRMVMSLSNRIVVLDYGEKIAEGSAAQILENQVVIKAYLREDFDGLAPLVFQMIFRMIPKINRENGTTILLVEQNANMALKIAHRGYVLENGRITLEGAAESLLNNTDVKRAYLGL